MIREVVVPNIQERAIDYLQNHLQVRSLHESELREISHAYTNALLHGIHPETKPLSSLKMIPTELSPIDFEHLKVGDEALIIEVGGTNIRGAVVTVDKKRNLKIQKRQGKELYIEGELSEIKYDNPDKFFSKIVEEIKPILNRANPKAIGVIYSFPGEAKKTPYGVDVTSYKEMTKGFSVPDIEKQPVGLTLRKKLKRFGIQKDTPIVVMNDTPAVLLAQKGAKIGCVVGTGFNLAMTINGKIFNTESGGFNRVPRLKIDEFIDFFSDKPGAQLGEKQISGKYIEEIIGHTIHELIDQGMLDKDLVDDKYHAEAQTVTAILEGRIDSIEKKLRKKLKPETKYVLKELSKRIRDRSAQLVGTMIGTAVTTFPEEYEEKEIIIPIEGSVFWKVPGYKELVSKYAKMVAKDKEFMFNEIPHAGILGAAAAALSQIPQK